MPGAIDGRWVSAVRWPLGIDSCFRYLLLLPPLPVTRTFSNLTQPFHRFSPPLSRSLILLSFYITFLHNFLIRASCESGNSKLLSTLFSFCFKRSSLPLSSPDRCFILMGKFLSRLFFL